MAEIVQLVPFNRISKSENISVEVLDDEKYIIIIGALEKDGQEHLIFLSAKEARMITDGWLKAIAKKNGITL